MDGTSVLDIETHPLLACVAGNSYLDECLVDNLDVFVEEYAGVKDAAVSSTGDASGD